jgi:ABC-type dipeptide/oligopeptide/nickel transport system permease component
MAVIYVGISFLVDLITEMINPRSREGGGERP